jgi:hypothetical protein
MYKRLLYCNKSNYNKNKFIKDYKQSQIYKKNSCRYPSIDFYKTLRISNYSSSLNFPLKKQIKIINNNIGKTKLKSKNKTPYQTLFYSSKINEMNNKKNKLFLEVLDLNIKTQKKIKESFESYSMLKKHFFKKDEINKDNLIKEKNCNINNLLDYNRNVKNIINYNKNLYKYTNSNKCLYNDKSCKTNYKEKSLSKSKKLKTVSYI